MIESRGRMMRALRGASLALALAGLVALAIWGLRSDRARSLAEEGVGTVAYLTAKHREGSRLLVDYRFGLADGRDHHVTEEVSRALFERLATGDDVWVVYWHANPDLASIDPDRYRARPDLPLIIALAALAGAALIRIGLRIGRARA